MAIRRCVPKTLIASGMSSAGRVLEQQRRPLFAHGPLHDLGHLEVRIDRHPNPREVAVAVESGQKVLQISESHRVSIGPGL